MKGERAEVAVGSPARPSVRSHAFELRGALRGQALSGRAAISVVASKIHIVVTLTNNGAGHAVPSGLPEHQLVVTVAAIDSAGRVSAHAESNHGRVLVDARDHEVPFYKAVRQRADTRIHPGQSQSDTFDLDVTAAVELRIQVGWRSISSPLADQLNITPPPDEPMLARRLPLPLTRRRTQEALSVELTP
jgi:hypothetical protein